MNRLWRWTQHIWAFRCLDHRGHERRINFPYWRRYMGDGVPRPVALHFAILPWSVILAWIAVISIPIWGQCIAYSVWKKQVLDPWRAARVAPTVTVPTPPSDRPLIFAQLGSIALMAGAMLAITPTCNRRIALRHVHRMLERSRCPWCSYDLSGSLPDPGGLTTCPECGGAWRVVGEL